MRKQKSRQKAPLLTRILSFLLVASMMLSMNAGIVIYAAAESVDTSHRLQNGSFEMNQTWEGPYKQVNQNTVPYWNTTAIDGRIELLHENTGTYIDNVKVTPSDRLLAAELNADEESTLYQDIKTFPASVYKWGLDHGARNGTDTMALVIGPTQSVAPSKPEKNGRDQFMQMIDWLIAQNLTSIKTEAGLGEQLTVYSKKFDENGTFADNAGNNAFSLTPSTIYTEEWHIWIMASSKTTTDSVNPWYSYGENGDISSNSADPEGEIGLDTDKYYLYTVPEGQTETTFAFVSVGVYQSPVTAEKAKTYGNFLDNINFEIYYPLSGSTTTHGSAVVSDSGGSTEGEGASDGYKITVDDQLATYITDGKTLKIQAVVKKEDADNSCAFVGVYCTTRDEDDNPVTKFIQTANNSNWERTVNGNGDIIYTYYIENITSPIDLHFIFIKNPTITYDPNGGLPYIAESEYNTTEADNVYSFKPAVNQNAGEGESATIFIPPYTSHAATGKNDGWKFTGWLLTGDSTTETPPEELGRLILPAEHTVACDYDLSHASSENASQYFKVYDGNIHLTESIQNNDGVPSGVVWEDNGESIAYGNIHNGLTMIAQWRWRQAFVPQVDSDGTYVDSTVGGTVDISHASSNVEHYDDSYNEDGGKAYYAITNETVTATATANDGFVFEGWYSASGKLITTNPTYSYTETKESVNTYYARFSDTVRQTYIRQVKNGDTYEITDDDSIATIDRYSYVDSVGKPISATALPTEEYKFDGWYDAKENEVSDDMLINDGMTISYTTTESARYYARFSLKEARPADRTIGAVNYIGVYDGNSHGITVKNANLTGDIIYYSTNGSDWSTTKPTRKNVQNEETVYVKVFNPTYKTETADAYIKITPRPITITVNNAEKYFDTADPEFTGNITEGTLVTKSDLGEISYRRTNTDEAVGTYPDVLSANYTENGNYEVTVIPGDFVIKTSSVDGAALVPDGGSKVYDGTPLFASAQVNGAEGYTIYYQVDGSGWTTEAPFVTNVSEGEVTVHTKAVKPGYVDLMGEDVTIQITPRPITITVNDAWKNHGTDDPEFIGGITEGTLVSTDDIGEITYSRSNNAESVGEYPGVLTASYTANSNYQVTIVPGKFTIKPLTDETGAILTPTGGEKIYDGEPLYASAQVTGAEGYTIYYQVDNGDWTTEAPSVVNVDEGEVTVHTKAVKPGYVDLMGKDVTIQITPRPITITVNDAWKNHGADDPTFTGGITSGSLVIDDDLGEITYSRNNADENVGTYTDVITAGYADNHNYEITVVPGDFTIRANTADGAELIAEGGIKVYDGTPLYARATVIGGEGYTVYFKAGNGDWTTEVPSVTDVADGEVIVQTKAVKDGSEDVFCANVTIQITPRPITITVNDSEKDFGDTDPDFYGAITSGSLVDDDDLGDITYYRTNDDEDVGTYREVLNADYTRNNNYKVSVIAGDFIINDNTVIVEGTLIAEGGAKVYDGTPLYASARVVGTDGYTIYYKVNDGDWTTDASSVLNVSEGKVTVHTKAVKAGYDDLLGNDVTIQITPRSVILTSATDSKPYDETPLTNHQVTVSGDGFIENEGADYTVTGSQTEIGSSNNTFTYELYANTDASNYNITVKEGTLTVTSVQPPDEPEEPDEPDKPSKPPKPSKPARPEKPAQPENPNPPTLTKDHVAYIIGYVDGTVRPNNLITRAEVTTIFFRLLSDESRSEFWSQTNPYSDVSRNLWCNNAISTLTNAGIILGYNDGTFKPDAPITRAQLAAIAVRFSTVIYDGDSTFNDVPSSHWASRYIALAEYLGWINGYRDNTFKPDQYITRAEAITLINRVLERDVEEEYMLPGMITWIDNPPYTWCYEAIQEATNSHDYTRTDKQSPEHDFNYEAWLRINPVPNWAGLEREWSTANSK